jgi:hypothetical protein
VTEIPESVLDEEARADHAMASKAVYSYDAKKARTRRWIIGLMVAAAILGPILAWLWITVRGMR